MRGRRGIKVTQEKMDSLELEHYIEGRIGRQGTGIEVTEGKDEQLGTGTLHRGKNREVGNWDRSNRGKRWTAWNWNTTYRGKNREAGNWGRSIEVTEGKDEQLGTETLHID